MYKGVFIDIDGTLIRSDHSLSQITIGVIQRVKQMGIKVVLVSARPLHGILSISKQIGFSDVPIASLNGSYIALDELVLYNKIIEVQLLSQLYNKLKNYNVSIIYYQQMKWFAEAENRYTINEQKITEIPLIIASFNDLLNMWKKDNTGPNKLLVVGEPGQIKIIQEDLRPSFDHMLNMYTSKPIYLEVMDIEASKTYAVQFFMEKYNFKREEVIAIGDNFNDKEMIEFAGVGIAMGNAPDEVKNVADYVTDTNNNDGVAKALSHFLRI